MTITSRILITALLSMLCACNDGSAQAEQPGDGTPPPVVPVAEEETAAAPGFPPSPHPAGQLYRIKWSAECITGHSSQVEVVNPECIVTARGGRGVQVFNSRGEIVLYDPGNRVKGREEAGLTFRPDGSYYRVTKHTEDYQPGKPYMELAYHDADGTQRWSNLLTAGWITEGRMIILPDGILTGAGSSEKTGLNEFRTYKRYAKFDMEGELAWSREEDVERNNHWGGLGYGLRLLADGTFRECLGSTVKAYDAELRELWAYAAYGVRRDFTLGPDGAAYALLKGPERLVKVGLDGELAWSCNISEHATGHINSYYETGHAHGEYLAVGPDGTVYVCDAYYSLTAISAAGEYRWSVQDPRRAAGEGDERLYDLDYLEGPVVAPDGTIYLKSDEEHLMAVSPAGEVLWVDKRFTDITRPPVVSPDGTVYVSSGGWIYALDPAQPALLDILGEQEAIVQAEREEHARWEAEWAAEREAMLAQIEAEGGDPDEYLAEMYGFGEPDITPDPDGPYIADRTEVAAIILPALKAYYGRHGEYPPFLKGVKHSDDPLIAEGFLAAYPLMWPQPGCHCGEYHDWSSHVFSRWGCATAPPEGYGEEDTDPYNATGWRDHCGHHGSITASNSFGYRRGDFMGAGAGEAWLWFYGSNIWPEQNNPVPDNLSEMQAEEYYELFTGFQEFGPLGLDLETGRSGRLVPDGIPDGICLLYRLRDGELVEVVRAEGI